MLVSLLLSEYTVVTDHFKMIDLLSYNLMICPEKQSKKNNHIHDLTVLEFINLNCPFKEDQIYL